MRPDVAIRGAGPVGCVLALLLKETPLGALEQLGRHGEVMPQKSTYFFPKPLSGLLFHPLDP